MFVQVENLPSYNYNKFKLLLRYSYQNSKSTCNINSRPMEYSPRNQCLCHSKFDLIVVRQSSLHCNFLSLQARSTLLGSHMRFILTKIGFTLLATRSEMNLMWDSSLQQTACTLACYNFLKVGKKVEKNVREKNREKKSSSNFAWH